MLLEKTVHFTQAEIKAWEEHMRMWETNHLGYKDEILRARAWNEEFDRQQALKTQ